MVWKVGFFSFFLSLFFTAFPRVHAEVFFDRVPDDWYREAVLVPPPPARGGVRGGGSEVVVAVLDSGIDLWHPDLQQQIWVNPNEIADNGQDDDHNGYVDDVYGWDFVDQDGLPLPEQVAEGESLAFSHGTLVAGIIAAEVGNEMGADGLAPSARILALRVLDPFGVGQTSRVAEAIRYAVGRGARVINISFTSDVSDPILTDAIRFAYARGVVIVAAVGNASDGGKNLHMEPVFPACVDQDEVENRVIGVSGVNREGQKAEFSNFGKGCADIAAPSVDIWGLQPLRPQGFSSVTGPVDGTSLAAPMVSAAAAELLSLYPSFSPETVRLVLQLGARPFGGEDPLHLSMGTGILSLSHSLEIAPAFLSSPRAPEIAMTPLLAVSEGQGSAPRVRVLNAEEEVITEFSAFSSSYRTGVRLAVGDVNDDGAQDIIATGGSGSSSEIRIFTPEGRQQDAFLAFESWHRAGVRVAVGDVNGDSRQEIVVVEDAGGSGRLRVFNFAHQLLSERRPFGMTRVGLTVAVSDVNEDGIDDVIVGKATQGSLLKFLRGDGSELGEFFLEGVPRGVGLFVTAGNVDADASPEIIIGSGAGERPLVHVFGTNGVLKASFLAYDSGYRGGVQVALVPGDALGVSRIATAPLRAGGPHLRIFDGRGRGQQSFFPFETSHRFGLNVAGFSSSF